MSAATLFDVVTSGAIISVAPHGGVSVNMSIDYFHATPSGQVCEIDAKLTKLGRALAFTEVIVRNKSTGQIAATGTDIKFIPSVPPSSNKVNKGQEPFSAPIQSASPTAATAFISDLVSATHDGFDSEATRIFEATALYALTDTSAREGQVVCTLPVRPPVQNIYGTLHGGCIGEPDCTVLALLLPPTCQQRC